jgi:rhodanese-related sulfurtransferase
MDFLIQNWPLLLLAIVSGGMLAAPMLRGGVGGGAVGAAEAVRLINREKGVLVDVCEPAEFAQGHPAGARNVPLGSLDGHKDLPSNKTLPIIVTCATGARSSRAAGMLRKAGYEKAVTLSGGLRTWREANLPVETGAETKRAEEKPARDHAKNKGERK